MNNEKIILDLCGGTGAWSVFYKRAGSRVIVITLPDFDIMDIVCRGENIEIKQRNRSPFPDMWEIIPIRKIYGILFAPPCTYFSFARTNAKKMRDLEGAMRIVKKGLEIIWFAQHKPVSNTAKYTTLKFWALENPYYGLLKNFIGKPCYVFNPYDFGDGYQKKTALWGNFNEPKKCPVELTPQMKKLAKTNSYLHKKKFDYLLNDEIHPEKLDVLDRQARRAITPAGFAKAFYEANK